MTEKLDITITKDCIHRLLKDVKYIIKNPLDKNGIYYKHHESDVLKGYALIIGPKDTVYENGYYFFEFWFPTNYPHSPPVVKYHTNDGHTRFNPNFYRNGKVCLSLLNTWKGEGWTSCQTINSILLTLCMTLNNEPLLNEPGLTKKHKDYENYNKIITYKNYRISIVEMLLQNNNFFNSTYEIFYDIMVSNFIDKYDLIKDKCEKNLIEFNNKKITLMTGLYALNVEIDYKAILKSLKIVKNKINEILNDKTGEIDYKTIFKSLKIGDNKTEKEKE